MVELAGSEECVSLRSSLGLDRRAVTDLLWGERDRRGLPLVSTVQNADHFYWLFRIQGTGPNVQPFII